MKVFEVEELAVLAIDLIRPLMPGIRARDRALAEQLARAATSVVLNIGEGNYSDPGNKRARWFTAAGSANEARLALRAAVAFGYCSAVQAEAAVGVLIHVRAILRKLNR